MALAASDAVVDVQAADNKVPAAVIATTLQYVVCGVQSSSIMSGKVVSQTCLASAMNLCICTVLASTEISTVL